ncbi:MAG: WD40 repeat domain-containing protein [Caulobacterales bacterium]|nr:WD40 repeat domain-containing protein [Caulobacterales bacterium]
MTTYSFDAPVTAALFDASGQAAFALGDGTVRFAGGQVADVHDGAVLSACLHPSGQGVVTGGDDGRVVWSRPDQALELADLSGKWIDALASSSASGLIAFSAGRTVTVLDAADPHFRRDFSHERSVADLAFEPKGRKLACATYGAVVTWFARIETQKPTLLKWAGSHTRVAYSPDGAFLISAMQENQLHGWRLKDSKDLRMGGYPSKIRDMTFFDQGRLMATSGANGAVVWPFVGSNGPMGKEASEIGHEQTGLVVRVAAAPGGQVLAAGLADGRVWSMDVRTGPHRWIRADKSAAITALIMSADGRRLAWGDETGEAGIADL